MQLAGHQGSTDLSRQDEQWLGAHWMPFTGNRDFKANPRIITAAQGAYYTDADGRRIFDGLSGLWCTGLGHGRREIAEAIGKAAARSQRPLARPRSSSITRPPSSSATRLPSRWPIASSA